MADILRIAKERRDLLLSEIAELDEFVRTAEAIARDNESWIDLQGGPVAEGCAHPVKENANSGAEIDGTAAPMTHDAKSTTTGQGEPPRFRLSHSQEELGAAKGRAQVKSGCVLASAPQPRTSGFAGYLEGLRAHILLHFGSSHQWGASTPKAANSVLRRQRTREAFPAKAAVGPIKGKVAVPGSGFEELRKRGQVSGAGDGQRELPTEQRSVADREAVSSRRQCEPDTVSRPFCEHLGQKVRQRRWMLGLTREQLGNRIGVKVKQIEQYETGIAQIDATRLWDIATALKAPVAFFFEGLDDEREVTCDARAERLSDEAPLLRAGHLSQDKSFFSSSRSA